VAQKLAAKFLAQGNYTSAPSMKGSSLTGLLPAAASEEADVEEFFDEAGFAGLAVQAVGHEVGSRRHKVHVYVTRASRKELLAVPTADGEVLIETNRVGRLVIQPEKAQESTHGGRVFERGTRIACGSSCGPAGEGFSGTVGTLGALVRKENGGALYLLSNNHVLAACNQTPVGMPIMSPGMADAGPDRRPPEAVGRHAEICELRTGEPSLVRPCQEDVALARVIDPARISSWQGDADDGYDTPRLTRSLESGLEVKKIGRTSGLTTGVVEAKVSTPTPLFYKLKLFTARVWFQNFWTVVGDGGEPFALPGDSGSLVVTRDGKAAVGLVFAFGDAYAWIIPMEHILTCFEGIKLVDKHGVAP
jgi:hypothetical protein